MVVAGGIGGLLLTVVIIVVLLACRRAVTAPPDLSAWPGGGSAEDGLSTSTNTTANQGWKFMSCSHCQELGQGAKLTSDWLFTVV